MIKNHFSNDDWACPIIEIYHNPQLEKYFLTVCLENDSGLLETDNGNSPYKDYNVRGIDHRLEMGFLWVWPWDNTVRLTISEKIPRIDGRVKGNKADEA